MYKYKLDQYFNLCRSEFVETICTLVRINSAKGPALSDMPYGTGPAEALHAALQIARCMGSHSSLSKWTVAFLFEVLRTTKAQQWQLCSQ